MLEVAAADLKAFLVEQAVVVAVVEQSSGRYQPVAEVAVVFEDNPHQAHQVTLLLVVLEVLMAEALAEAPPAQTAQMEPKMAVAAVQEEHLHLEMLVMVQEKAEMAEVQIKQEILEEVLQMAEMDRVPQVAPAARRV